MTSNNHLSEILSRWEAMCARAGRDVAAHEVWPDGSPEEQAELARLIAELRRMNNLFPPPLLPAAREETLDIPGYEFVERLGAGGFGVVWKVRKKGDSRFHNVLKVVNLRKAGAELELAALDVIQNLKNDYLVRVNAAWHQGDLLLIEMELADGGSLWDVYKDEQKLGRAGIDREVLLGYLRDAAAGLDFLNERRHRIGGEVVAIGHRDIKPQNLLLVGGRVKVADFGLARALRHALTGHTGPMTPPYAAPEFFRGQTHERSDQYSLAVTYCKLVGGRFPFTVGNEGEWRNVHENCPPDLTMLRENEWATVARALAVNPEARWPSCQEFVARLRDGVPSPIGPNDSALSDPTTVLPPSVYFTGRDAELEQLRRVFTEPVREPRARVQILSGQGGNGKTQLALMYAHKHRAEYTAVFWVRAHSPSDLETGFAGIARQLGLPEAREPEQVRAVAAARRWLEEASGWLLVLDNADEPDAVQAIVPRNPKGHTLLTSRARTFRLPGVRPIDVAPFAPAEALQFLLNRTHREDATPDEENAAVALVRELGCLPLALEQAGAYILEREADFRDYLVTYRTRRLKLLEECTPVAGEYPASVATTWALNFDQVKKSSRASADLLRISIFLHPDAIPLELIEQGAERISPAVARTLTGWKDEPLILNDLLEPLTRYSLVLYDRNSRTYSMHPLVQEVLRTTMNCDRLIHWAEHAVRVIEALFPSGEFHTWSLCERLLPHALCALRQVEGREFYFAEAGQLLNLAGRYLAESGQFAQAEPLHRRALGIFEKVLGPDHPDVAMSLNNLASILHNWGDAAGAEPLCRRALAIAEKALGPDHPNVAMSLNNLGSCLREQGHPAKAEPLHRRALAIREKAFGPNHPRVAISLDGLAACLDNQGRAAEAEPLHQRALAIREKALGPDPCTPKSNTGGD